MARRLGVSGATYFRLERSKKPLPMWVGLAGAALVEGLLHEPMNRQVRASARRLYEEMVR